MALNLADRLAVRPTIVPRCTAVVVNYALYLLGLPGTTEQLAWAREAIRNPESVGEAASYYVLSETTFIDGGSDITDAAITSRVENVINTYFIQPAA